MKLTPTPFREASRYVAYSQRRRILVAAVLFPLPLLFSIIGNIRLAGLGVGNATGLLTYLGIYISLILFLISPVRFWWGLRVTFGIIAFACFAGLLGQILSFRHSESFPAAPAVLAASVGVIALIAACRPRPNPTEEERRLMRIHGFGQSASRWTQLLAVLVLLALLLPALWALQGLFR